MTINGWYFIYARWHCFQDGLSFCEKYHLPRLYTKMSRTQTPTLPDGDTACEQCKQLAVNL